MIGVILAAGQGKRLRAAWDLPKVLLPIGGKTLLENHIEGLRNLGADKIVVVVKYRKEEIIDYAKRKGLQGLEFVEGQEGDTKYGRSLQKAMRKIGQDHDIIYVMGDHYIRYEDIPKAVTQSEGDFILIGNSKPKIVNPKSASRVLIDENGEILHNGKDIEEFDVLDTGLFILRKKAIPIIMQFDHEFDTSHIVDAIRRDQHMKAIAIDVPDLLWFGCNTPEEVLRGMLWLEWQKIKKQLQ